ATARARSRESGSPSRCRASRSRPGSRHPRPAGGAPPPAAGARRAPPRARGRRRGDVPGLVLGGVLDGTATLLFATAFSRGLLSVVAVLGGLYPVVTVILAQTLLHERLARGQRLGVVA